MKAVGLSYKLAHQQGKGEGAQTKPPRVIVLLACYGCCEE